MTSYNKSPVNLWEHTHVVSWLMDYRNGLNRSKIFGSTYHLRGQYKSTNSPASFSIVDSEINII